MLTCSEECNCVLSLLNNDLSVLQGNDPYPWPMVSSYPLPKNYILDVPKTVRTKQGKIP